MLALGCDQAGYGLMQEVKKHLDERGLKYVDCGTYSEDSVDYPVYSKKVVKEILEGRCDRGILICGHRHWHFDHRKPLQGDPCSTVRRLLQRRGDETSQ